MKLSQIGVNGFVIDLGSDVLKYDDTVLAQAEVLHKLARTQEDFRVISEKDYQYLLEHGVEHAKTSMLPTGETSQTKHDLEFMLKLKYNSIVAGDASWQKLFDLLWCMYLEGEVMNIRNTVNALIQIFIKGRVTREDYVYHLTNNNPPLYFESIRAKIKEMDTYLSDDFVKDMLELLEK